MQLALGVLGWSPTEFWNSSPAEFWAAIEGWEESNGAKERNPLTEDEYEQLKEKLKDKFPDGGRT